MGVSSHRAPANGTALTNAITAATRSAPVLRTRSRGFLRTGTLSHPRLAARTRPRCPQATIYGCVRTTPGRNLFEGRSLIPTSRHPLSDRHRRGSVDVAVQPPVHARPTDPATFLAVPRVAVVVLIAGVIGLAPPAVALAIGVGGAGLW